MAITPRASSTLALATRTNSTVTRPTGTTTGDYLVAALDAGGSTAATITGPSGWTQLGTVTYSDTDPWFVVLQLWGRFDDGAASWTWTHASRSSQAYVTAYIGVDPTTPIDVAATTAAVNNSGAGSTIDAPSQTIVTAGAHGIIARGSWDGNAITPPSGWTERLDTPVLWVGDRDWSAAGATGAVTVAAGNSSTSSRGVVMAALRPAGASIPSATGSGTFTFTGTGVGKRTPKATSSGTFTFTGTGTGKRTPKASGSGTFDFAGAASGKRTPKAAGAGTFTFVGAGTGKRTPKAAGGGTYLFTGAGTGKRSPKATGSGSFVFTGTGVGQTPGGGTGTGSGTFGWTGVAVGLRRPVASGSGTYGFVGSAVGARASLGVGSGTFGWTGTAVGDSGDEDRDLVITSLTSPSVGWSTNLLLGSPWTVSPTVTGWAAALLPTATTTGVPVNTSTLATTGPTSGTSTSGPAVAATTTSPTT